VADLLRFDGWILGASFASGHTFVFGRWHASPFGGFADLMRLDPDGTRTLVAPLAEVERFVDAHYRFDRVERAPVTVDRTGDRIVATAGDLTLELDLEQRGLVSLLLRMRPEPLRTSPTWIGVEDLLFRPLVAPLLGGGGGIHARGTTRGGARQWYGIHDLRWARARARLGDRDLGAAVAPAVAADFGASEFPRRPALVRVTSLIERVGAGTL
jgi:hypothetical protein